MPPDPQRIADTQAWIRKAQMDLRGAEIDLEAEPALLEDAMFHCQQAAEKTLKAFLTWYDRPFRKTHDLGELGHQCVQLDESLDSVCRRGESLTVYAWVFRYPGDPEEPSREDVAEAFALARELYEAVVGRLPEEAQL